TRNWLHSVSGEVLEEGDIECSFHLVRSFLELEETLPDLTQYCSVNYLYVTLRSSSFWREPGREPKRYWERVHV
ncbi:MAG: hypothetical protein ACYCTV_10505, partial [Leptospirales bacterium]